MNGSQILKTKTEIYIVFNLVKSVSVKLITVFFNSVFSALIYLLIFKFSLIYTPPHSFSYLSLYASARVVKSASALPPTALPSISDTRRNIADAEPTSTSSAFIISSTVNVRSSCGKLSSSHILSTYLRVTDGSMYFVSGGIITLPPILS